MLRAPLITVSLALATACQIRFDLPSGVGGSLGRSGAGASGVSTGGGGSGAGAAPGGSGGAEPALVGPIAMWVFAGSGRPAIIKDRVGEVDLFPYPVDSTDAQIKLEAGALVLSGGASLKSDVDPGTALIEPLASKGEFSIEVWAEMGLGGFEGKRVLFQVTGSELYNFNQFVTGAAFEVPSSSDGGAFLGDHRGQTRHWIGTFSASAQVVRLFVDGDLAATRSLQAPLTFSDKPSRLEIADQLWQGRVFLTALYDRALAASEVRGLYVAGWER